MASSTTDRRLGLTGGTAFKAPCKAATTANITLSGEQTIDGVSCVTGNRVLVKNQTTTTANGIYVVDTGSWTRDLDFDGANDAVQGTQVYINTGGTANGGGTFVVTTSGTITFGTTALAFSRTSAGTVTPTSNVATAGQTLFTVATYQPGSNSLDVYVNGIHQRVTSDYTETSSTSITFTYALSVNDEVDTYSAIPAGTLTAASASLVAVSDAADYFVGTTVEAILQEIAQGITADNGDASASLTNNSSDRIQRWNTTLTANRTATLSTSNAKEGATFIVVRGSGATGNFTLAVGSLATLRAPGEWCRVAYDAGTSAWILAEYGILPSAEIRALSADNGDADATLSVATSERTQRWGTTLTADRTATLSTTGATTGARFRVVRTEAASGLFSLIVSSASATLARLAKGQQCDVEYTGSAWIIVGLENLRHPNPNVVSVYDDFLGEEINGHTWQSLIGTDSSCVNAVVRPEILRGFARLTTGAGAGATMAVNGVQLNSRLNWQANQGGLILEFRLMADVVTSVAIFAGFTNQDSALQMPINGSGVADGLTNNANDAVGILFDTTMTTKNWWLVGVAGAIGAAAQSSGAAPVAAAVETWRIEISATGVATFYKNATIVGSAITGALTSTVPLTPVIAVFSRTNASRNVDIDFIAVQAQR